MKNIQYVKVQKSKKKETSKYFLIAKLQPQKKIYKKEHLQQLHPNRFLAPSSAFEDLMDLCGVSAF